MAKAGRGNIILPTVDPFEQSGLRRSQCYELKSYRELLEQYEMGERNDPLRYLRSDLGEKLRDYVRGETFIVPVEAPSQDDAPVHLSSENRMPLSIRTQSLLKNFVELIEVGLNWKSLEEGSFDRLAAGVLPEKAVDDCKAAILNWTNTYGLLFQEPTPDHVLSSALFSFSELPKSDAVYRALSAHKSVPYFLGAQAFLELHRYAVGMLFKLSLYGKDIDSRMTNGAASHERLIEQFTEGYRSVCPALCNGIESFMRERSGTTYSSMVRYRQFQHFILYKLVSELASWIKVELTVPLWGGPSFILEDMFSGTRHDENSALLPKYQCASLFSCIMFDGLITAKRAERYIPCPECGALIDLKSRRKGIGFCNDDCRLRHKDKMRDDLKKNEK